MKLLTLVALLVASTAHAAENYEIDGIVNDETLIINGEVFKAQTYCLNWEKGDSVLFIEGSPAGACATATLFNLNRKEACEVWCE